MKLLPSMALFCAMLRATACEGNEAAAEMPYGTSLRSPDGKFTVTFQGIINVKNNGTGEFLEPVETLRSLYSLKWVGNSRALVTVYHIAGGSSSDLIRITGAKWRRFDASPDSTPFEARFGRYSVVRQYVRSSSVRLVYACLAGGPEHFHYSIFSFDISAVTGKITKIRNRRITENQYIRLKTIDQSYTSDI